MTPPGYCLGVTDTTPDTSTADDGPACPDCGTTVDVTINELSDDEYTAVLSCPACEFGLETESNLAARDRTARHRDDSAARAAPPRLDGEALEAAIEDAKQILVDADGAVGLETFIAETRAANRAQAKQVLRKLIDRGLITTTPGWDYRASTALRERYGGDTDG